MGLAIGLQSSSNKVQTSEKDCCIMGFVTLTTIEGLSKPSIAYASCLRSPTAPAAVAS